MRLSKIYTRSGDKGTTKLADGSDLLKCHERIEAYGTVDELNSFVARLRDSIADTQELIQMDAQLIKIQNELFDIGGELASPAELVAKLRCVVSEKSTTRLEAEIDAMNDSLAPLKNFVLPGGHPANTAAHICRTVCRRAERRVLALSRTEDIRPQLLRYLNRLSDWLFVASRHASQKLNVDEILWDQRTDR